MKIILSRALQLLWIFLLFAGYANANNLGVKIRVYCFYIPEDKLGTGPEQLKYAKYTKLKKPNGQTLNVFSPFDRTFKPPRFVVSESTYTDLFRVCQNFVKDKGIVLDLKGTDASYAESITRFYRLTVKNWKEPSEDEKLLALDDREVLDKLGLNEEDQKLLKEELVSNPDVLHQILENIGKWDITQLVQGAKELAGNKNIQTAVAITAVLAFAWFAPPLVASGMELLYPLVYQALFGIPSKFGLAYWLVYAPGKAHAVHWAYANAGTIISALGTLASGAWRFYQGMTPAKVQENLESLAQKTALEPRAAREEVAQ